MTLQTTHIALWKNPVWNKLLTLFLLFFPSLTHQTHHPLPSPLLYICKDWLKCNNWRKNVCSHTRPALSRTHRSTHLSCGFFFSWKEMATVATSLRIAGIGFLSMSLPMYCSLLFNRSLTHLSRDTGTNIWLNITGCYTSSTVCFIAVLFYGQWHWIFIFNWVLQKCFILSAVCCTHSISKWTMTSAGVGISGVPVANGCYFSTYE